MRNVIIERYRGSSELRICLMRKPDAYTAYYRLDYDNWLRRYLDPGEGYGLMIRRFEVTGKLKQYYTKWVYPISVTYLPNEFHHPDDDLPRNWETAKGWLFVDDTNPIIPEVFTAFILDNILKYKP